jgi:large subunit ribosomal protein L4
MSTTKTKAMVTFVDNVASGNSALLLLAEADVNVEKSARNLTDVKTLHAGYLNIRDLLGYEKILMSLASLKVVNSILADDFQVDEVDTGLEEE